MSDEVKRGRGRPKKEAWADLSEEFKDSTQGKSEQELRNMVALVAMQEEENKKNMKEDQHLQELKVQVKDASAGYREATKINTLKVRYLKETLEMRGKETT